MYRGAAGSRQQQVLQQGHQRANALWVINDIRRKDDVWAQAAAAAPSQPLHSHTLLTSRRAQPHDNVNSCKGMCHSKCIANIHANADTCLG